MDTDSAYMSLSGELEDIIRPNMKGEFYKEYGNWFPRLYCNEHREEFVTSKLTKSSSWEPYPCCKETAKYDIRTPGLFKEEFRGEGIIALNSKTYFCWSEGMGEKYSSKGLSKHTNKLTKVDFFNVLTTGNTMTGVNRGFVRRDGKTFTYEQTKRALTYFYAKRRVCDDGVSTENIML